MSIPSTLPHTSPAAPLADIATRARSLTSGSGAAIALKEGDRLLTVASSGDSAPDVGVEVKLESSFAGLCFQTGITQVCSDTETDKRVNAAACRSLQVRSIIATPIREADAVRGVLAVFAPTAHAFDGNVAVLATLADITAELLKRAPAKAVITQAAPAAKKEPPERVAAPQEASTVVHLMSALDPEPAKPTVIASAAGAVVPWPKESAKEPAKEPPKQETAETSERKPTLLLPAEDLGPREFRRAAQATIPNFAMLDQMQKPARRGAARTRIALAAAACVVILVVVVGGWRWQHAAKADPIPVVAAAAPAPPSVVAPTSAPVTPVPPEPVRAEKVVEVKANPAVKERRPATSETSFASTEPPASVLPKRTELAIMIPTPLGKDEREPEVAAPAASTLASNRLPELSTGSYVPKLAAAQTSKLVPARLIKAVSPVYPEFARKSHLSDKVVVAAVVTKYGTLSNLRVVRGMAIFHNAAIEALRQWRYQPAVLNGEPVESSIELEVRFTADR